MKNLARMLTRPGPSFSFWLFMFGMYELLSGLFPTPTFWQYVVGTLIILITGIVFSVVDSLLILWSSKS